jgi:hypothetical protein
MGHSIYDAPGTLKKPYVPQEVPDRSVVFKVSHLMPPWEEVKDFDNWNDPWCDLFSAWFFTGLTDLNLIPKDKTWEREDFDKALRHIKCITGSFEPSHEHKTASVTFLLQEWFERGKYRKKGSDEWVYINSSADDDWEEE